MGHLRTSMPIDMVDDHDNVIGLVNRADLPENAANFRVVHLFVYDKSRRLLLQRIAKGQRSAGLWGSSAAGYVLAGEDYDTAARRKLRQELGIKTARVSFLGKTSMRDLGATKFIALFEATYTGRLSPDSDQVAELRFEDIDEVSRILRMQPELFTPTFRAVFEFYRS